MATTALPNAVCEGNPTFQLRNDPHYVDAQIPGGIHGYICRMPPIGSNSCPRLKECCGDRPYHNITSAVPDSSPFYPASCVAWCAADPSSPDVSNDLSDLVDCVTTNADGSPVSCEVMCEWVCQKEDIVTSTGIFEGEWCPLLTYSEMSANASGSPSSTVAESEASTTSTQNEGLSTAQDAHSATATASVPTASVSSAPSDSAASSSLLSSKRKIFCVSALMLAMLGNGIAAC